jgi:hypothetical protein
MRGPHTRDLRELQGWLNRPGYGGSFLRGTVEGVWDAEKGLDDYATFDAMQTSKNAFTAQFALVLLYLQRCISHRKKPTDHVYSLAESSQWWMANGVITVTSSVFPVVPIIILFFVERLLIRLGLILVFTAVFSAVLVFGMRMEPDKVLAITTA